MKCYVLCVEKYYCDKKRKEKKKRAYPIGLIDLFRAFHSLISVQNSGHLLIIIITIITDEN
jgi:hypothetical protein